MIEHIKKMFEHTGGRLVCGFTHFYLRKDILIVAHAGNMGGTIKNVDKNVKLMGLGSVQKLKDEFELILEEGTPDYYYELKVRLP